MSNITSTLRQDMGMTKHRYTIKLGFAQRIQLILLFFLCHSSYKQLKQRIELIELVENKRSWEWKKQERSKEESVWVFPSWIGMPVSNKPQRIEELEHDTCDKINNMTYEAKEEMKFINALNKKISNKEVIDGRQAYAYMSGDAKYTMIATIQSGAITDIEKRSYPLY